jgi:hypothetical protein
VEILVLIEPVPGKGYRASPFGLSVEGATREEALERLRALVQEKLSSGAQLVSLPAPSAPRPWEKFAGTWRPDDPRIEEWKQAVEEYRQEVEADPNSP